MVLLSFSFIYHKFCLVQPQSSQISTTVKSQIIFCGKSGGWPGINQAFIYLFINIILNREKKLLKNIIDCNQYSMYANSV